MPRRLENLPEQLWRVCAYEPREGRMIFFPSWLPHKVNPITKGKRISLVGWVHGPFFK